MNTSKPLAATLAAAGDGMEAVADRAEGAIQTTRHAANGALDALQSGVDSVRDSAPSALDRAAARADELARRGIERARVTSDELRHRLVDAGDRAGAVIRDEPVKSVLIAAATGAAVAMLVGWLVKSRSRARLH